jgi:ADP-ribose pyrophosphatase
MKIINSEELLRTPIFWITKDKAVDPDGFEIERAIVQHVGSAVILPINEKGRVLLARQFRLPAKSYLWEIPAGRLDEGETPLRAAKRELREETGLTAKKWTKLFSLYMSPGFLAEKMTIFAAEDLKEGEPESMEDERIETRWFKPKELDAMIDDGKLQDGKTVAAWLYYKASLRSRK